MSKSSSLFWVDMALFVVMMAAVLTGITDIFTRSFIHAILGISMCIGALLHPGSHWTWVKNASQRYDRLPEPARSNVWLDLGLFCSFILCGGIGLSARAIPFPLHRHIFLGVIHVGLAVLVLVLLTIHISRHWKWITTMARKINQISQHI